VLAYLASIICIGSSYAIATLGLNLEWGFSGFFNIGVAAFFAVGAYTSAILSGPEWGGMIGGFGLPFPIALIGAAIVAGILGYMFSFILRLKFGFFAIASIMFSTVLILIFTNEMWLTNGVWGIGGIPRPFNVAPKWSDWVYAGVALSVLVLLYFVLEMGVRSPWGRVQRAIKEDVELAKMLGKNTHKFMVQSLIIGSMYMGIAGAIYAHFMQYINPMSFDDVMITFLCLVMVIVGGSGNNRGSILGAFLLWSIWTISEILTGFLPEYMQLRAPYIRVLIVGIVIILLLRFRPNGLLGKEIHISKAIYKDKV
jgi:branched-chain amino acid transport system permease protein